MRPARLALVGLLGSVGCGGAMVGTGAGRGVPRAEVRGDDRVLLSGMAAVQAIASSFDVVYVVHQSTVGVWQPRPRSWAPPIDAPSTGLGAVFAAAVDPLDQSLWMIEPAALLHLDPLGERWDRIGLPFQARGLALDPTAPDEIWIESADGWYVQPRVGPLHRAPPRSSLRRTPRVDDAFAALPGLQSRAAIIARGPLFRPGRLTAAAPDPLTQGWYLGTDHNGLLYVAPGSLQPESLSQGIAATRVGAIRAVPGGVWVATDRGSDRPAEVTHVDAQLAGSVRLTGDDALGLRLNAIREILVADDGGLWLGSDQGVVRLDADGRELRRWGSGDGLTDPHVLSVVSWQGRVMVGMSRGLVAIDQTGLVSRPSAPMLDAVYDMMARGDTLWLATDRGLAALHAGDSRLGRAADWPVGVGDAARVVAVFSRGDTLVAVTPRRLIWRDESGTWWPGPPLEATTGPIRVAEQGPGGIWVAGDRALALVIPGAGVAAVLVGGRDLPAPVTALAVSEQYLWVGTLAGLMRIAVRP